MFSKVISSAVLGVDGTIINVEADVNDGLPMFTMVGYLSSSVKEAGERVRTALKNSGYHLPPKRVTINLSPADIRKDGSAFDLPIAIAVLIAMGITPAIDMEKTVIIGELGLNGEIKPVTGILPMVHHCYRYGITKCIVPIANVQEALLVRHMEVVGVSDLREASYYIQGILQIESKINENDECINEKIIHSIDFNEISGQGILKRGMEIAVAGFHNVLMTGAAGAGKSMLAKRLPTIMPEMSFEESVEVTKIYSIAGLLDNKDVLVRKRPFRAPHHTISNHALVGGGMVPKPGEVSLAHNGVLFLDELLEFDKSVLEVMRQPLEDRKITISRVHAAYSFPADFMLVAAMNPCPCGYFPDMKKCSCSVNQIKRYQSKISGPLLDRIDINMEVKPVTCKEIFNDEKRESSEDIRSRVQQARMLQIKRYENENIFFNSQLEGKMLKKYIRLGEEENKILEKAFTEMDLSARGVYRILKLARTIADLALSTEIKSEHLQEALFYRNSGSFYYNNYDKI